MTSPGAVVFTDGPAARRVSVIVPLHNYRSTIGEALDSVAGQEYRDVALIVVDDASSDDSRAVALAWMERHAGCGLSLRLLANDANAGLSVTRNTGIAAAGGEFCFFLDADNAMYPRCLGAHVAALEAHPGAAGAYALIEVFGRVRELIGTNAFARARLAKGNYIDAMAMVRRSVLLAFGGYAKIPFGWEDYDLWLRLCEAGETLVQIPQVLSRYRNHESSMLRQTTNAAQNIERLHAFMKARHPWLEFC